MKIWFFLLLLLLSLHLLRFRHLPKRKKERKRHTHKKLIVWVLRVENVRVTICRHWVDIIRHTVCLCILLILCSYTLYLFYSRIHLHTLCVTTTCMGNICMYKCSLPSLSFESYIKSTHLQKALRFFFASSSFPLKVNEEIVEQMKNQWRNRTRTKNHALNTTFFATI